MLETRFPRIPGDIGNPESFDFPVRYRVVPGASAIRAVQGGAEGLLAPFLDAARAFQAEGAGAIATSCGFLSLFQQELEAAVDIPVFTSSLLQVRGILRGLPRDRQVGILTISARSLTSAHLVAAGAPPDTPVGTTEGLRELTRVILNDEVELDIDAARADMVDAARSLQASYPTLGAMVLECTNMGPYHIDVEEETGLPVYSIVSLLKRWRAGA